MNPTDYINASDGNGEAVRANILEVREIGDMSLIVDSVLNYPHKFIATTGDLDLETGLIDPDTMCIFYAHLDGSIVMIDDFAPGYSDVGHEVGQVMVLKPTTAWADAVAEGAGGVGSGIIVSPTPPASPEEDMFWLDETEEGEAGTNSYISNLAVMGTQNGTNLLFTVQHNAFVAGSLNVYVNGLLQAKPLHYTESDPTLGTFTFGAGQAPVATDVVRASYQVSPASANNADTLDNYHLSAILEAIYPIGSVYVSGSATMPALIAGIGTWTRVLGRVIVGLDESQTEFDTVNEIGGHKLLQAHNHPHREWLFNGAASSGAHYGFGYQTNTGALIEVASSTASGEVQFGNLPTGGGNAQNLQPYKVKYMWERTA